MRTGEAKAASGQVWPIAAATVVALQLLAQPGSAQPAGEFQVARLPPSAVDVVPDRLGPLPRPLAFGDIVRYRQIFALQRETRWAEADRLAAGLDDDLLLGHVLAERYVHPTAYRSSYAELAAWLERYADHPQAPVIHRLALSRKPSDAPQPRAPTPGEPRADDREAIDGERPSARELWREGLAAWRAGAPQAAAERFARLADDERLEGETLARAAFWAARASLRARKPRPVARFLRMAARGSDEFYGLLAQRTLDETVDFDWHEEQLKESMLELLLRYPAARRAIALAHVGEPDLAEEEVVRIGGRAPRRSWPGPWSRWPPRSSCLRRRCVSPGGCGSSTGGATTAPASPCRAGGPRAATGWTRACCTRSSAPRAGSTPRRGARGVPSA
jgi:hypothetical protein